jgi:hypothetical protein
VFTVNSRVVGAEVGVHLPNVSARHLFNMRHGGSPRKNPLRKSLRAGGAIVRILSGFCPASRTLRRGKQIAFRAAAFAKCKRRQSRDLGDSQFSQIIERRIVERG